MMTEHDGIGEAFGAEEIRPLSKAGTRRREAMLAELRGEVVRVHRVRVRRRRAVGGVVVLLLAAGGIWLAQGVMSTGPGAGSGGGRLAQGNGASESTTPERSPGVVGAPGDAGATPTPEGIVMVSTDPGVTDRYAVKSDVQNLRLLGDTELLHELRGMGRECGIVRVQGMAFVTCGVEGDGRSTM